MGNTQQNSFGSKSQANVLASNKDKEHPRVRSASPGPSISSDSDIPYVPYTVNRPIGDSPKLSSKSPAHSLRASATPSPRSSPKALRPKSYAGSTSGHDIIVVKEGTQTTESLETDADFLRLQKIFSFQPIMRGALNVPTVQDPEVLSKLNHQDVLKLCQRYQEHLRICAEVISTEQNALAGRIREIDFAIATLTNLLTEKQKKFMKYSEQLAKTREVCSAHKHCLKMLSETVVHMDSLNWMLPPELQLEPFVVMTG